MTDGKTAFRALLEKGSDATFLREMIGFAAERLMQLETDVDGLIGAGRHERSAGRTNQRNGYRDRTLDTRLGGGAQGSACAAGGMATWGTGPMSGWTPAT